MKKTEQEKQNDKARRNLGFIHSNIRSAWSAGLIHTWGDVYRRAGITESSIIPFPFESGLSDYTLLRNYLKEETQELERKLSNEVQAQKEISHVQASVKDSSDIQLHKESGTAVPSITQQDAKSDILPVGEDETGLNNTKDYGLISSPNWKVFHYWFQKKAIKEALDKILGFNVSKYCKTFDDLVKCYNDSSIEKKPASGILILAGTGTGKTFIMAALARILRDLEFEVGKTHSHIPYIIFTRTTVVNQTARVCQNSYNLYNEADVEILNIEKIRSKHGKFWIKEDITIIDGEEVPTYTWKKGIQPCVIFFDESQAAKNSSSKQHKIMCAYNNLKGVCLVSFSATPFTKVSEAKCFAVSTHRPLEHLGFPTGSVLTNENWQSYANSIAHPDSPDDHNEAAIERLMKDLDPWIVRVTGVRPQFKAINTVKRISFQTPEERQFYDTAWKRFLEEKAKYDDGAPSEHIFTILLKFSMAAEICRKSILAKEMFQAVQNGKAAVCACKFKGTIIAVVQELNEKYGVPRSAISLIWGGGQTQLNKKQKQKANIIAMSEKLKQSGLDADDILSDLDLDKIEDRELLDLPEHLRLGAQTLESRQDEIDRFQSGKSLYCMYTFRAGGVGLSLHHTDEFTDDWDRKHPKFDEWYKMIQELPEKQRPLPGKCRRKESGYAVEEDIPFIPVRPRENFVAPTYSPIETVQGLGRCPRLTSLSDTIQKLIYYAGTIEDKIANICNAGLRCLSKVVKFKESWSDVITGTRTEDEVLESTKGLVEEDNGLIEEGESDEE